MGSIIHIGAPLLQALLCAPAHSVHTDAAAGVVLSTRFNLRLPC